MSEEEHAPWNGPIIGYSNRGPLYRRPVPYRHTAVSNRGELGTAMPRTAKNDKKPKKPKNN